MWRVERVTFKEIFKMKIIGRGGFFSLSDCWKSKIKKIKHNLSCVYRHSGTSECIQTLFFGLCGIARISRPSFLFHFYLFWIFGLWHFFVLSVLLLSLSTSYNSMFSLTKVLSTSAPPAASTIWWLQHLRAFLVLFLLGSWVRSHKLLLQLFQWRTAGSCSLGVCFSLTECVMMSVPARHFEFKAVYEACRTKVQERWSWKSIKYPFDFQRK